MCQNLKNEMCFQQKDVFQPSTMPVIYAAESGICKPELRMSPPLVEPSERQERMLFVSLARTQNYHPPTRYVVRRSLIHLFSQIHLFSPTSRILYHIGVSMSVYVDTIL